MMSRLKEVMGPQAWVPLRIYLRVGTNIGRTLRSSLRKPSVIPPEMDPMNSVVALGCAGVKDGAWCICCCAASADIEGPWPYDCTGGLSPSPSRFGCMMIYVSSCVEKWRRRDINGDKEKPRKARFLSRLREVVSEYE